MEKHPDGWAAAMLRARILSAALMGGVAVFAGVAVFLISSGAMTDVVAVPDVVMVGLIVLAVAAIPASNALSLRATGARDDPRADFVVEVLVRQAMREGIGLAGIVLGLIAASVTWTVALAGVTLVSMALGWPREDVLRQRIRREATGRSGVAD